MKPGVGVTLMNELKCDLTSGLSIKVVRLNFETLGRLSFPRPIT